MKKYIYIFIMALAATAAVSCDSFLDRQEDEALTFEKIWTQRKYTQRYFYNCMGYLPVDANIITNGGCSYMCATDEATIFNETSGHNYIMRGALNTKTLPHSYFSTYYEGIRDCNIFLQNVYRCSDPNATDQDKDRWYYGVRFTRAYLYFLLMREWGPVFLLGDELVDFTASTEELYRPRNTWDECVKYVVDEMTLCADNLPEIQEDEYLGIPTRGAAQAVISRLLLYNARPLFNGNIYYRGLRNPDNTPIFPAEYDAQKWYKAAEAALAIIQSDTYELYKDPDKPENGCLNYAGVFQETWNKEIIFCSGGYRGRSTFTYYTAPTRLLTGSAAGAGSFAPTQQQVDAYAMKDGRYPITGYESDGTPRVDNTSGYPAAAAEFTLTTVANPYLQALGAGANASSTSPAMYKDREPRFYVNVYWPGSYWKAAGTGGVATFAIGGPGRGQNYPRSGYMVNKYFDHGLNYYQNGSSGNITFPTFRLAEIYLNYIEAVLECEKAGITGTAVNHAKAMKCWEELRKRSSMGKITDAYPEATTFESLIELVHKERRVELAHEGHRYFDTRTWMIATETDAGTMYGLNVVNVSSTKDFVPSEGWARYGYENRIFKRSYYLLPFPQREIDRNHMLVQNYGW